ncbi:MAG: rhodanese-like domain-containing protein [Acidimicrobiales bacterium]
MRRGVDELVVEARAGLHRPTPLEASALVEAGGVLVDTRPSELRRRDGEIPGAWIVDRNQLEWRLDPSSPYCHDGVDETLYERPVILFCDEGWASSLAVRSVQRLGLDRATDLDGGFQAWAAAGLPVRRPGERPATAP